jgi:hypothetical protein
MAVVIADAADTQSSQLPQVVVIDLGNGNIEFVSDAGSYRF